DKEVGEVFVANRLSNVSVISDATNTVVATIPMTSGPWAVVYLGGTGEVFITNFDSNTVSVISDSTNAVSATIPVGGQPFDATYDGGKGEVFVTNSNVNQDPSGDREPARWHCLRRRERRSLCRVLRAERRERNLRRDEQRGRRDHG